MDNERGRVILDLGPLRREIKASAALRGMTMRDWFIAAARCQLTLDRSSGVGAAEAVVATTATDVVAGTYVQEQDQEQEGHGGSHRHVTNHA